MTSLLLSLQIFLTHIHLSLSQQTLEFSAISVLHEGTTGKSIVGAQWLAMQEINNNTNLLPNINLELLVHDSEGSGGKALVEALRIIHIENRNHTHFPIILGCPWSSLNTIVSPALGAFDMGQISSGATSISLSDTSQYKYFYRTIPSDALQAQGIILLCKEFNWTRIAVVHVSDAYGLYLSIGITELALKSGITATAVAFSSDEPGTLTSAAYQVAQLNTFIIVFIVHDTVLDIAFNAFKGQGLTGYPYYYIGVDAWLDAGSIQSANVTLFAQGSIGTIPWQTLSMPLASYDDSIKPIINESMRIFNNVLELWDELYTNGYSNELNGIETPSSTAIYGYDSLYTLAKALDIYIRNYGDNISDINITKLNDIIINEIDFIGASGRVIFDKHGDRAEGLYAFGNALSDGNIEYFGYFYRDVANNNELKLSVEYDKIRWPIYFESRGIKPQSDIIFTDTIVDISQNILIPIYVLCILSICVTIILGLLTWKYRTNRVIRAASWKINMVMCIGSLFGYIAMIIYGIDEHSISAGPLFAFYCNFRLWFWIMSYTLLFMPLFAKTYRLSRIFSEILDKKTLEDKHLLYGISICLAIDLLFLTIYTAIEPLQRMYISGSYEQIDELQTTHYIYGSCETNNGIQYIFYGLIALWKCIESLFGIYCALIVSRVGRKELTQFDETTQQLLAIGFLIVALCIAIPVGLLGSSANPSYFYAVVGFLTISVGNVTVLINMLPRLFAVLKGNENKYSQTAEQKMERLIREQMRKIEQNDSKSRKGNSFVPNSRNDTSNMGIIMPTQSCATSIELPPVIDDDEDETTQKRELHKKTSETPVNNQAVLHDNVSMSPPSIKPQVQTEVYSNTHTK